MMKLQLSSIPREEWCEEALAEIAKLEAKLAAALSALDRLGLFLDVSKPEGWEAYQLRYAAQASHTTPAAERLLAIVRAAEAETEAEEAASTAGLHLSGISVPRRCTADYNSVEGADEQERLAHEARRKAVRGEGG